MLSNIINFIYLFMFKIKLDVIGDRVVQLQAPEGSVQFKNYVAMQTTVPRSLQASSSITYEFAFSRILDQSVSQRELYLSSVDPLVSRFHLDASNSLVFCYGVTNSGKTYTLFGASCFFILYIYVVYLILYYMYCTVQYCNTFYKFSSVIVGDCLISGEKTQPGLVPRALYDIFVNIKESNAASEQTPLGNFLFKPKTFVEAVIMKQKDLEVDKKIKAQILDEVC